MNRNRADNSHRKPHRCSEIINMKKKDGSYIKSPQCVSTAIPNKKNRRNDG